jgi:hypothetical protein
MEVAERNENQDLAPSGINALEVVALSNNYPVCRTVCRALNKIIVEESSEETKVAAVNATKKVSI